MPRTYCVRTPIIIKRPHFGYPTTNTPDNTFLPINFSTISNEKSFLTFFFLIKALYLHSIPSGFAQTITYTHTKKKTMRRYGYLFRKISSQIRRSIFIKKRDEFKYHRLCINRQLHALYQRIFLAATRLGE